MGNLNITAAKLAEQDGRLAPFIQIEGRWYSIETKPSLLEAGIAMVLPVTDDLQPDYAQGLPLDGVTLPSDGADSRNGVLLINDATRDSGVVAIARKAAELLASDDAQAGSIERGR